MAPASTARRRRMRMRARIDGPAPAGDARAQANRIANQRSPIRPKNGFWRAAMRRKAAEHENFFIAKNTDSESTQPAFRRHRRAATASIAYRASDALLRKRLRHRRFLRY
jgi:hypothetical protein